MGLGTASADSPFHVKNSVNTVARFESTDSVSRIVLKDNSGEIRVGATGDNLTFHTSSSETERARIDSSGNMGLGESSPAHELHVSDADKPEIVAEDTTDNCKAYLGSSDSNGRIGTLSNHDLAFRTNDTERMRLDSSGRLFINHTADTAPDAFASTLQLVDTVIKVRLCQLDETLIPTLHLYSCSRNRDLVKRTHISQQR